jgi:hypothetical protein
MDGFYNEGIDRILAYLRGAKACGRHIGRAERRKISNQIEVFEKRFAEFLADSAGIPKLREDARDGLAQKATNGLSGDQVAALEKFLIDSKEVSRQRVAVDGVLLKFATMRSLLNGGSGN